MNFAGGRTMQHWMDISMEFYASEFGEKYSSVSSINHPTFFYEWKMNRKNMFLGLKIDAPLF